MLEQVITGLSKTAVFTGKEITKGIVTAKKELNPNFLKQQAGAIAKFELMKSQYTKMNGSATASIDLEANKMFQAWKAEQDEQQAMAEEMFKTFQEPVQPAQKTYTAEEVEAIIASMKKGEGAV